MSRLKVKDNKKAPDKIQKKGLQPLSKLCFSFDTVTQNKNYSFKKVDKGSKVGAYEALLVKLNDLSSINAAEAHERGKIKGMEKIPYVQLSEGMQKICDGTGIVTKDSKVAVFRFCNQQYRMICKDDLIHSNLMHIIAFDFDYSAYDHG